VKPVRSNVYQQDHRSGCLLKNYRENRGREAGEERAGSLMVGVIRRLESPPGKAVKVLSKARA